MIYYKIFKLKRNMSPQYVSKIYEDYFILLKVQIFLPR